MYNEKITELGDFRHSMSFTIPASEIEMEIIKFLTDQHEELKCENTPDIDLLFEQFKSKCVASVTKSVQNIAVTALLTVYDYSNVFSNSYTRKSEEPIVRGEAYEQTLEFDLIDPIDFKVVESITCPKFDYEPNEADAKEYITNILEQQASVVEADVVAENTYIETSDVNSIDVVKNTYSKIDAIFPLFIGKKTGDSVNLPNGGQVVITKIFDKLVPELNDELIKAYGYDSYDELITSVKKNLFELARTEYRVNTFDFVAYELYNAKCIKLPKFSVDMLEASIVKDTPTVTNSRDVAIKVACTEALLVLGKHQLKIEMTPEEIKASINNNPSPMLQELVSSNDIIGIKYYLHTHNVIKHVLALVKTV